MNQIAVSLAFVSIKHGSFVPSGNVNILYQFAVLKTGREGPFELNYHGGHPLQHPKGCEGRIAFDGPLRQLRTLFCLLFQLPNST